MEKNNYYEWLELPLEQCEMDSAKLLQRVETYIQSWSASKNQNLINRSALYAEDMRVAVSDAKRWQSIYNEYKQSVDNEILRLITLGASNHQITIETLDSISKSQKVKDTYIKSIATQNGYKIINSATPNGTGKTLDSIAPEKSVINMLNGIQNSMEELSIATIDTKNDYQALMASHSALKDLYCKKIGRKNYAPILLDVSFDSFGRLVRY